MLASPTNNYNVIAMNWSRIGFHSGRTETVFPTQRYQEGDIGGYPIPQYRTKKWQIPKYRVANRLNTDTAYFNYIYNRFRILMVASI